MASITTRRGKSEKEADGPTRGRVPFFFNKKGERGERRETGGVVKEKESKFSRSVLISFWSHFCLLRDDFFVYEFGSGLG